MALAGSRILGMILILLLLFSFSRYCYRAMDIVGCFGPVVSTVHHHSPTACYEYIYRATISVLLEPLLSLTAFTPFLFNSLVK